MTLEEIAKNLRHPQGEQGIQIGVGMNQFNHFINQTTYELMDIQTGDDILEVGMGNGNFIPGLLRDTKEVSYTGLDVSATMIQEALKYNATLVEQNRVRLIKGTIESIPFPDQFFRKACTVNTIYFWNDLKTPLNEIFRILKPEGTFVLAYRPKEAGDPNGFRDFGFKDYSESEIQLALDLSGFRINKCIQHDDPPIDFNGEMQTPKSQYFVVSKEISD